MSALTIGTSEIRQLDGLFSLNDLHKASGGNPNHRPNQFLRIDQTRALIEEISNAQICAIKTTRGVNGGTYACRELVIAYAAWISPAFHLKVIRVFLERETHPVPDALVHQLRNQRFFMSFTYDNKLVVKPLLHDEIIINRNEIPKCIRQVYDSLFPVQMVVDIARACTDRLEAEVQRGKKNE